jgi:recombinational DNA repair ATPase RecF
MLITQIRLKNWRNFVSVDVPLRERVYLIGANASGKSNFLDALRFLRDVAKPDGGGFQKAVKDRGGVPKIRCLAARRDPMVMIEVELAEAAGQAATWRYRLELRSEGKGLQRALVEAERIENLRTGYRNYRPSDEVRADAALLHLERARALARWSAGRVAAARHGLHRQRQRHSSSSSRIAARPAFAQRSSASPLGVCAAEIGPRFLPRRLLI